MRRNGLGLLLALATMACQSPPPPEEPATATRAEVALALHRQLEYVCERHRELAADDSPEAREERDELVRLATEIATRILRVDPQADLDQLVALMSEYHAGLNASSGAASGS